MPLRRRTTLITPGIRRPRVVGPAPAGTRPDGAPAAPSAQGPPPNAGGVAATPAPADPVPSAPAAAPAQARDAAPAVAPAHIGDGAPPAGEAVDSGAAGPATRPPRRGRGWIAALRARPVLVLAIALATAASLAVGFAVADHLVRTSPSAANTALADVGATTEVTDQLGSALETVYSYDFTRLDENERLARAVITPEFAVKFGQLFAPVREIAPQQQAVVSATVTASAVQSIEGDRAVLVAFLDQQATRVNAGPLPEQRSYAGRLTVIGQRAGDTWKIADIINR